MTSCKECSEWTNCHRLWRGLACHLILLFLGAMPVFAQQEVSSHPGDQNGQDLQRRVEQLEQEVAELRRLIQEKNSLSSRAEASASVGHVAVNSNASGFSPSSTEGKSQGPTTTGAALSTEK